MFRTTFLAFNRLYKRMGGLASRGQGADFIPGVMAWARKVGREVAKLRKNSFEAMDFEEAGGLALKAGQTKVAAGLKQVATEQYETCESRGHGILASAEIHHHRPSRSPRRGRGQPARFGVRETLAGGKKDGLAGDHGCLRHRTAHALQLRHTFRKACAVQALWNGTILGSVFGGCPSTEKYAMRKKKFFSIGIQEPASTEKF